MKVIHVSANSENLPDLIFQECDLVTMFKGLLWRLNTDWQLQFVPKGFSMWQIFYGALICAILYWITAAIALLHNRAPLPCAHLISSAAQEAAYTQINHMHSELVMHFFSLMGNLKSEK